MIMDHQTQVIKCHNPEDHAATDGVGNILCFVRGDSVFIKCSRSECKRWTRIMIRIPGVNVNLENAAFIQKLMPQGYHFDALPAKTVIEE